MSPLAQRILTAACLAALLLLALFLAPLSLTVALAGLLMLGAAWEWSVFLGPRTLPVRVAFVVLIGLLILACDWLVPERVGLTTVLGLALAWWLAAFVWLFRYPTPVPVPIVAVAGCLVLVPAWLALATLLRIPGAGRSLTLLALSMVFAADIGAYFAGRRFGRRKLAPKVSPGKTWEGVAGGLLAAAVVSALGGILLDLPLAAIVTVGLGVAALSVVGDLTESLFKRHVGAKDSGHLFPGHGGLLDRLDSITAGLPLYVFALALLGVIAA